MIAKIDLIKLGRNCAVAITENGGSNTLTYVEDSSKIEVGYNQNNNTVTVTISGTTSATTKDITTGTFLTMDSGSGAVTITSYATFKTNYALLFLNGGSAPTPTLNQVIAQNGNTCTTNALINLVGAQGQNTFGEGFYTCLEYNGSNNLFAEYRPNQFLCRRYNGINITGENIIALNPLDTGNTVFTNYLPVNSGTLLNGNFNENNLGLNIDYTNQVFTLGNDNTGKGLKIDTQNNGYYLGNDNEIGLQIYNNDLVYILGNGRQDGVFIDSVNGIYKFGKETSSNQLKIDSINNQFTITTQELIFTGSSLIDGSSGGNSGQHLVITLNGTTYKIKLEYA